MKILLKLQNEAAIIGIARNQHPINVQSVQFLLVDCLNIVSSGVYFFTVPETFQDYAESILGQTAILAVTSCFVVIISQMQQIFNWIDDAGQIIDTSKLKKILFYFIFFWTHSKY